jgi:hypothetical protein
MNTTTLFPTMSIIYRWNQKRLVNTIMSYLLFYHLTRLFGFSLSSPLRLSVFGQLIWIIGLIRRYFFSGRPRSRFQHNEKRPRHFGCPNSDSVCPNSDKTYLTFVTCSWSLRFFIVLMRSATHLSLRVRGGSTIRLRT